MRITSGKSSRGAIAWLTFVVGMCALIGACSRAPSEGPLHFGDDMIVEIGMDTPRGDSYPSIGYSVIQNPTERHTVELTAVELVGTDVLSIHDAYVLPHDPDEMPFGMGFMVPPDDGIWKYSHQEGAWGAREPLAGFTLEPGDSVILMIRLDTSDPCGGTSESLRLGYTMSGRKYSTITHVGVEMSNEDAACSSGP